MLRWTMHPTRQRYGVHIIDGDTSYIYWTHRSSRLESGPGVHLGVNQWRKFTRTMALRSL